MVEISVRLLKILLEWAGMANQNYSIDHESYMDAFQLLNSEDRTTVKRIPVWAMVRIEKEGL